MAKQSKNVSVDSLAREVDLLKREVFYLTQVVRLDRAVLQYIANRDASIDATVTVTPATTLLDRSSVAKLLTTGSPSLYKPISTAKLLYEHLFDTQVVP